MTDDLDALLAPNPASPNPALNEAIFLRTQRVMARRRLVNRFAKVGTLAAVLAIGIGLGTMTRPGPDRVENNLARVNTIVVPVVILVPVSSPESSSPSLLAQAKPETASQAELLAEQADDRGEAARLYRVAGDRFLNDAQDYRNAARCYRLYLERAGEVALVPVPSDTWLLTSLKNSLFKEKSNVAKTDG